MNSLLALLRKHFSEARWVLGLSIAAFFGLSILTIWLTLRAERAIEAANFEQGGRSLRGFRLLGARDFSTLSLEVSFWNHPLIILTVLGWAITRGAAAVSGEIERGSLDLVLSRPISRSLFLLSHVTFAVLGVFALAAALIAGNVLGSQFFAVKEPPSIAILMRPGLMLATLGLAAYGYTLPLSAIDIVRWRPGLIASAFTLAGVIAMTVAPQFEGYEWLERVSIFRAYAPITVATNGAPLAYNATVLTVVFAVGVVLSFLAFSRRDLPTNS